MSNLAIVNEIDYHGLAMDNFGSYVRSLRKATGLTAQKGDADLTARNATLYARNQEWLRTTVEALRTLVESHGPGGQKMQ